MITLKICGIRRAEDIEEINKYPEIKYAGFVFYKKSKRYVTPQQAAELIKLLRPDIKAVGVFAEVTADEAKTIADTAGLDILQLHSDEDEDFIAALSGYKIWRALRVKDSSSLLEADRYKVSGFVLDGFTKNYGGEGVGFDHSLARDFVKNHFTVIAGGINSGNINEVYSLLKPNVTDLSSSVETDGFKDGEKIRQLITAVRKEEK